MKYQRFAEYAINADIRKRGADEVQADASIRGGSTDQTLIMLNGYVLTTRKLPS